VGVWKMESRFDIVTIANAVCVAGYVAMMLAYVALNEFGLSRAEIRGGAIIAALLMAAVVAIDFAGKQTGKAK
jgi:hypothetical protein